MSTSSSLDEHLNTSENLTSPLIPDSSKENQIDYENDDSLVDFAANIALTNATDSANTTAGPPHDCIRHVTTIASSVVTLISISLFIASYLEPWTDTGVEFYVHNEVAKHLPATTLYEFDYWENIHVFRTSGAEILVYIMYACGIVIPSIVVFLQLFLVCGIHGCTSRPRSFQWMVDNNFTRKYDDFTGGIFRLELSTWMKVSFFLKSITKLVSAVAIIQSLLLVASTLTFEISEDGENLLETQILTNIYFGLVASAISGFVAIIPTVLLEYQSDRFMFWIKNVEQHHITSEQHNTEIPSALHDANNEMEGNNAVISTKAKYWHKLHKLLVFESGIVATVLVVPAFSMPVIRFEYVGLGATYLEESYSDLTVYQVAIGIWQDLAQKNVAALITSALLLKIMVCPIATLVLTVLSRLAYNGLRQVDWVVHRALCYTSYFSNTLIFVITTIMFAENIESISEYLFDEYKICKIFHDRVNDDCLIIKGKLLAGTWVCLAQALSLEIFTYMTLRDFKARQRD